MAGVPTGRTGRTLAELEEHEAAAARAARTRPPPAPAWKLSAPRAGGGAHADAVHPGDCGMGGRRTWTMTRDRAPRALPEDGTTACPYCRPDRELGVL
ncbi:DUF6233 domain-containing protein [Streptomyces sp. NPDC005318]|uniref:DUF6233 domain-containing protein n=1 Tax=Streptomyces sp. NPDC005318 TaxID=3157031 RepID=UPI0033B3BE5A